MTKTKRDFFEIVKERSAKITSALNALELAEQSLEKQRPRPLSGATAA